MKNLTLNACGVTEMNESQTRDVNGGGILVFTAITIGVALFDAGYKMGADRAEQDK